MTSRTIDIHCDCCRTYLFSLQPNSKRISEDFYCKNKACQQQAVVEKLKKEPNNAPQQ